MVGAGLDDDGRKAVQMDQYLDWARRVSRTGLWWDGFMPVARSGGALPELADRGLCSLGTAAYVQISGTGQDADRMTLPHQQSDETGPVSASDGVTEGTLHPGL